MSGVVSRWLGSIDGLPEIAERMLRVQIENRPALELIGLYDSPTTLFCCDPPYPHESRGDTKAYGFEMTVREHEELSTLLHEVKGNVALSGYRCSLLDNLYKDWRCIEAPTKLAHSIKQPRTEALWVNYQVPTKSDSNYAHRLPIC